MFGLAHCDLSGAREYFNYDLFRYFEVRCGAAIGSHAALWSGCYFGRGGTRNSPYPAPLRLTASVHFFLLRGGCHHFLVCRDRTRPPCSLALLSGDEPFFFSHQNGRLFIGILHHYLRNIRLLSELV